MEDLNKLLEGGIDDVKAGLSGLSHDNLLKLKAAETAGKNRKGVIDALDNALNGADAARAGGKVAMTSGIPAFAADLDNSGPAGIAAATEFSPSGAPRQVTDIDVSHPAVDNDPRAGTTVLQNRIDFNDPVKSGSEVVTEMLKDQAKA